jgi:RNA polymerase sigma factor (TIGR02999 family)
MAPDTMRLLQEAQRGDDGAIAALFEHLYPELRALAHHQLRRHADTGTLGTTALIHEAYIKLCDHQRLSVRDRAHFFALSARVMRQILVDYFRAASALKRGAGLNPEPLEEGRIPLEDRGRTLLALHEALERLAAVDARLARVVEYRFFGGMTQEEIGGVLDVSPRTVRNDWRKAKAWLGHELR